MVSHCVYDVCTFYINSSASQLQYKLDRTSVGLTTEAYLGGDLPLIAMFFILLFDVFLWSIITLWLDGVVPSK